LQWGVQHAHQDVVCLKVAGALVWQQRQPQHGQLMSRARHRWRPPRETPAVAAGQDDRHGVQLTQTQLP
jgi:hypothetical protein